MVTLDIHSILFIPEIQAAITSFLIDGRFDTNLTNCQAVSRAWHEAFTPHFWKAHSFAVRAVQGQGEAADMQVILQRIGLHIRHVRVHDIDSFSTILSLCPNIITLALEISVEGDGNVPWTDVVHTLEACRKLESLTIHRWEGSNLAQMVPELTRTLGSRLRHLTIYLGASLDCPTSILLAILMGLPCLASLILLSVAGDLVWRVDHDAALLKQQRFHKLRSLVVEDHDDLELLLPFWRQSLNLEQFDLSQFQLPPWMAQTAAIEEFTALFHIRDERGQPVRPVKILRLPDLMSVQDNQLTCILHGCVRHCLTWLDLGECALGYDIFRTLLETQSDTLEGLTMEGRVVKGLDPSPWIQRLLSACPRLKELKVKVNRFDPDISQVVRLHVDDVVTSSPWICSSLSSLHIPIVGVPTDLKADDTVEIVERVMRQLGRMEQLTSFGSGFHCDLPSMVLRDTLPFSLGAGGLQHLSGLRRLQTLNVTRYAHRIRYAEARWMGEHWHQFREVVGLDRLWENSTTHPAQWLRSVKGVYVPIS